MFEDTNNNVIDATPEETGLAVRSQAQMSVRHEMSPESLRASIARETEMQKIVTEYVRDHMIKDHHYYSFNEGGKPALTKDGAHRICSLFKVIPGPVDVEIIREEGGHFTVVSLARLFNADGLEISSGRGSASTRESKYAYRWVYENQVPNDVDKATLQTRSGQKRGGSGTWTQYRLPNPDLADLENTIIKMSEKRATVAAVNKLPLVSELFATDPDSVPPSSPSSKPVSSRPSATSPTAAKPAADAKDDPKELAMLRDEVEELISMKVGDSAEDRAEFLKGRDPQVMSIAALEKLRADLAAI